MIDFKSVRARGHRQNIERYCRLLATELTDLERQYLHKRIAEEHAQLERLKKSNENQQPEGRTIKDGAGEHCEMLVGDQQQ
jgi:hypothetical protein